MPDNQQPLSRSSTWIAAIALLLSLASVSLIVLLSFGLKDIIKAIRNAPLYSLTPLLLTLGQFLATWWPIPTVGLIVFYFGWVRKKTPRVLWFNTLYCIALVVVLAMSIQTYYIQKMMISEFLRSREAQMDSSYSR